MPLQGRIFRRAAGGVVMPSVQAQLTEEDVRTLMELAAKRGVDANTILQQAITTEKLIADNVGPKDDLLIRRSDNSFVRVEFKKTGDKP
jgi:hypothetical protein